MDRNTFEMNLGDTTEKAVESVSPLHDWMLAIVGGGITDTIPV
jgi:hypothetical protein